MKIALILYDSVYGNTKKVAIALSRGLEAGGLNVDTMPIESFDQNTLNAYDIIGIGGPTHFHGVSKKMRSFLSKLEKTRLENKAGFVFETKADFLLSGSAAKKIMRSLQGMKLNIMQAPITAIVLGKEGPLADSTLRNMEQVGISISENNIHKNQM
jgi:flavodoxin